MKIEMIMQKIGTRLMQAYDTHRNSIDGFYLLIEEVFTPLNQNDLIRWKKTLPTKSNWSSIQCIQTSKNSKRGKTCRSMMKATSHNPYTDIRLTHEAIRRLFSTAGSIVGDLLFLNSKYGAKRQMFHADNGALLDCVRSKKGYLEDTVFGVPFSLFYGLEAETFLWVAERWNPDTLSLEGKRSQRIPPGAILFMPSNTIHAGAEFPYSTETRGRGVLTDEERGELANERTPTNNEGKFHVRGFTEISEGRSAVDSRSQVWFVEKGNKYGLNGRELPSGESNFKPPQYEHISYNLNNDGGIFGK